ncbi:MAG: 4-hydroxybenzoate polyprenyl transferase [Benjaminiella poitrasii]|nr:MAG: 4-hydroxybenzoate polyprenyl transferase [Benjaminiella poitrasii]
MTTHFSFISVLKRGINPRSSLNRVIQSRSLTCTILNRSILQPTLSIQQPVLLARQRLIYPTLSNAYHKAFDIQQKHLTSTATSPQQDKRDTEQRILYNNWLDRLPAKIAPYAFLTRIDKPIGTWLLFWPCAWGISMAAYRTGASVMDTASMIALFGTGALIMRGAGCTINDLWDRDIDNKVERTKVRPITSGAISPTQAIGFLGLQLTAGLAILTQLNMYSILLGASSLSLVVTYPLMKRITYWPQTVLGLAYNWGSLLGWSAMTGSLNWSVVGPLYVGGVCWTLVYDTIYAHQDKKDDVKAGVRSTALRFGDKTPQWLTGFSSAFIGMTALAGYMNGQGAPFYAISVVGTACHLAWQLKTVDYHSTASCWSKFKSNTWAGAILWSGILADAAYSSFL